MEAPVLPVAELTFLASPGMVDDWRKVVLLDTAAEAGILAALPASAAQLAERMGVDERATRVLLDALAVWHVVEKRDREYTMAGHTLGPQEALAVRHPARAIRRWSAQLKD